jgi:hypothetical protein
MDQPLSERIRTPPAPPELSYPGLSPQVLARVRQLWSARGLDLDRGWHRGVRALPGFHPVPGQTGAADSAPVDRVFLFDQALIWVRALHEAAAAAHAGGLGGMTAAQWHGLAGITARLTEQMAALRLLALTPLPMPAMQIARALSEDVDTALVLLIRPRLAARLAECRTAEDATDFWRRHIAGGRAFKAISERLYSVGIDHSADTDYARWRKSVLTVLGTAVHGNLLDTTARLSPRDKATMRDDSLYFATFRIHELCAYAQLVTPGLTDLLDRAGRASPGGLAPLAAPLCAILVAQIRSLTGIPEDQSRPAPADTDTGRDTA